MCNDVVTAARQRSRSGGLGPYVDGFCARLGEFDYRPATIRSKLGVISDLARWMEDEQITVIQLGEEWVEGFLAARRRRGRTCRGYRRTLLQLLALLRDEGVVRVPDPVSDDTPTGALLARYEGHLRRERGLAGVTVTHYLRVGRAFAVAHVEVTAHPALIDARAVRDFLRIRARGMAPRSAQGVASALRAFLRFLFLRGETDTDLALAVPTVRQWRQADVPRYLSAPDAEQLLGACADSASATGRRDHAILLLLARLGLRAGEVVALELDDLRWHEGEVLVRGKGGVRDRLPLLPDVGAALASYLRTDRPRVASRRVFLCAQAPYRGFANPSSVSTIVARRLARAGLVPPTRGAHLLRHGLATKLLRCGASMSEIGELLRHRSPATTEIYARLDTGALRDVALPWPAAGGVR